MPQFTTADINRLMSQIPKGKTNAINAPNLAILMGLPSAPNQEDLRDLIRMAIDQGELIGSSHNGYWVLNSSQEVEKVLDSLQKRAQGTLDRRNNILQSWNAKNPNIPSSRVDVNVKP